MKGGRGEKASTPAALIVDKAANSLLSDEFYVSVLTVVAY